MAVGPLSAFELPAAFLRPALEACRLSNTALDAIFYDVPRLVRELAARGVVVGAPDDSDSTGGRGRLNLGALKDPEGSLLLIDPVKAPYVRAFHDLRDFLECPEEATPSVDAVSIAGVGSSALGAAALAWNVAEGLQRPALAIVPGYGLADAWLQALGGWFGFGFSEAVHAPAQAQATLGALAPHLAAIGRNLSASAPDAPRLANGAPVFRTGSGASDVLHALLQARAFRVVVGHSKGGLQIENALASLPPDRTQGLTVVTLGCPIAETAPGATYRQYLGLFDLLGQLNAWGNPPDRWLPAEHSTNTALPLSLAAEALVGRTA
jgi:hypothetical protein